MRYTKAGWSANGNIYRNNLFKDIVNNLSIYYSPNCYYNDDAGGGKTFVSNIIINVDGQGVACGGGRDNVITDNILVNANFGYDQRAYYPGTGPNAGWQPNQARFDVNGASGLWSGLIPWNSPAWGRIDQTPAYAREFWAILYPWTMLLKTTNVVDLEDNYVPYAFGNTVVRNNVLGGASSSYSISNNTERLITFRDNINGILPEDIFVDYEGGDYTVKEDSKIYKLIPGFKACDFSTVGIQTVS